MTSTAPSPIRLLLVDDHKLFRRGLMAMLSGEPTLAIVGEAGDAGEALKLAQACAPDVILLDNHLPGVHGVDALPQLLATVPAPKVVMLTVSESADDLAKALSRGASGYLLKTMDGSDLVDAIRRVCEGQSVVSPEMTGKLVAAYREAMATPDAPVEPAPPSEPASTAKLSPRERDILREIAKGDSNKEIARTLQIAETTVKIHVQNIFRKLGLTSRVQAAVYAVTDPDQT